jgi:hypothetical protein
VKIEQARVIGYWRITGMDVWGQDYVDLVAPGGAGDVYGSYDRSSPGAISIFGPARVSRDRDDSGRATSRPPVLRKNSVRPTFSAILKTRLTQGPTACAILPHGQIPQTGSSPNRLAGRGRDAGARLIRVTLEDAVGRGERVPPEATGARCRTAGETTARRRPDSDHAGAPDALTTSEKRANGS